LSDVLTFFEVLMTHLRYKLALGALLALLALIPLAAPAQETLSSVQRELDRVERDTEREKELHKTERARAAEFERQKNERLQALRDQGRLADARIDSLKQRMEVERRRRAAQRGLTAQYQARQAAFRKDLDREIQGIMAWLEQDFPYQKEQRLSEWRDLAVANREATVQVEEVLARVFGLIQGSLDFAFDSEAYPGTYTASTGGQHDGTYVRLGAVMMAFSSSDGKLQAYLAKTPAGYVWRDKDVSDAVAKSIAEAVRVAQGKEAPRLVALPVEVAAKGGAK
jgi:hypothetical protein